MDDFHFMGEALREARTALEEGEIPVGAVVVYEGKIISRAHNLTETLRDPTAHAEMLAIRRAAEYLGRRRLNGCILYVTLEPCPMCAGAVVNARMDRLVFGARDEQYGCAGSVYRITEDPAFHHFCRADGMVRAEECRELLEAFFAGQR